MSQLIAMSKNEEIVAELSRMETPLSDEMKKLFAEAILQLPKHHFGKIGPAESLAMNLEDGNVSEAISSCATFLRMTLPGHPMEKELGETPKRALRAVLEQARREFSRA